MARRFVRRIRADANTNPNFFCDFQILPNGNYIVTNWQGHGAGHGGEGHQIVELDSSGTTVWSWQQDPSFVSSLQAAILVSGMNLGRLHVEDTTGEVVPVD